MNDGLETDLKFQFVDLLSKISEVLHKKGENQRAISFKKASDSISLFNESIPNLNVLKDLIKSKKLKFVGNSSYEILKEYVLSKNENRESEMLNNYLIFFNLIINYLK